MTDKIEITATPPWSVTVNGEEVASSDAAPPEPPDTGFPPLLAVGSWEVREDTRTPEVKVTFYPSAGFTPDLDRFDYFFVCMETADDPVDPTTSTQILSATEPTPRHGGERAPGTKIYSSVWVVSKDDPASFQNATADAYVAEQTLVGSGTGPTPPTGDWPKIDPKLVDQALDFAPPKYGNKGNSSSNVSTKGTAMLATIYAYNGGDKRAEVKDDIEQILDALLNPSTGPCGMNGPGAGQESFALAWLHLYRASDLWAGTSAADKAKIDAIFHAIAAIRAWEGNDSSKSGGDWTITGGRDVDYKDVGPNISFTVPACLVHCAEWFGYEELDGWLNSTSIAKVRTEVKDAFGGTGGNLYKTLNWRNLGISASAGEEYYRSGASSDAPTDDQINASFKNLKYYGAPLSDLPKFLIPNDDRGYNKVLPPTKRDAGSNKFCGVNQYAVDGNKGMTVDGKKRGYCLGEGSKMPWLGGEGAMPYEINGVDEGGIRSAMGYALWTVFIVNCHLLSMLVNGNDVFADAKVAEFIGRWKKAKDIIKFFDEEDYNSIAHAKTKKNGGPGPVVWSEGRDDWYPETQFFFWDAITGMAEAS